MKWRQEFLAVMAGSSSSRLPWEILMKIFSYLDAASLFCISHVSTLFHRLADDNVIWEKIYMSEFGSLTWKPKLDKDALKEVPEVVGNQPAGSWKKMYLRAVAGQEVVKWSSKLRDISAYTGLPRQTEWVLRLPWEILMKIFSYLDAASLFCISHVSTLFHRLADDNVIWEKIYMSEFGSLTWKPKLDKDALKEVPEVVGNQPAGSWKKMYLRAVAGQEVVKWSSKLRDISAYTGLPRQTEWVLRNQRVSWELWVFDSCGQRSMLQQSCAHFFKSSVIVCWSGVSLPNYHHINAIQLYGVRKDILRSPKKPDWRSLIVKLDMAQLGRLLGKDGLIKLIHLQPGFIIAFWRGQANVAFIMASLHFHKLVEKSLLGSPVCPYSETVVRPPVDHFNPKPGLHGYTLHLVLHNTVAEIMSGHFCNVSSQAAQDKRGLVELRIIEMNDLSQHRSLSGNVKLPWKSQGLEGSVENCCVMSLTLLDDSLKPFWCISSPVSIKMAQKQHSFDYRGKHYLMEFYHPDGHVKMNLVWLREQKQFFLIGLTLYIPVFKVNRHFSIGLKKR